MKRISLLCLCISAVVLVISGCSFTTTGSSDIVELKTQVAALQSENSKLKDTVDEQNVVTPTLIPTEFQSISAIELLPTNNAQSKERDINLTNKVTIKDICEFTINKAYISKIVKPPQPDSFYTYYEAKTPGTTYLDVVVSFKNLQTSGRIADEFANVKLIYNGKYEYTSFPTIEEGNGSDFSYSNIIAINPLQTGIVHYIIEIPIEVETSGYPIVILLDVEGETFKFKYR